MATAHPVSGHWSANSILAISALYEQGTRVDLAVGTTAQVSGTGDTGLRVRPTPGTSAQTRAVLPEGTLVQVLDYQVIGDGAVWYRVRYDEQGGTGWVAGQFLVPVPTRTAPAGQAPSAIQPTQPLGMTWDDALGLLLNPCRGLEFALMRRNVNVTMARLNPAWRTRFATAWPLLLPVLHQIAVDPGLGGDPRAVGDLISAQVDRAGGADNVLYSRDQAPQVLQDIEIAAQRGLDAVARGDYTVEPGLVLLAAVWSDADRRAVWRMTAYSGQGGIVGEGTMLYALEQGWRRDGEISNVSSIRDFEQATRC